MQTTDFYSNATGTLCVTGGRDKNAPAGVSLSIDDLSYIKQGSRANEESSSSFTPTEAQLAAMNSGITSSDVAQITTNKNNISTVIMKKVPITSGDLNNVTENSYAAYTKSVSNKPTADTWYMVKTSVYDNNLILQEAIALDANAAAYTRIKRSGSWQAWKLSNLNDTQLAAVNSGIDSAKVEQIETNKNNILFLSATAEITGWHKADAMNGLAFDYAFYYGSTKNVEYGFLYYRNGILNLDMTFVAKNMIPGIGSTTITSPTGIFRTSDNGNGIYLRPYIKIGALYKYGEQVFTSYADAPNQ